MPEFRYVVADANGQTINGTLEADNEEVCRRIIGQRGLYCLELSETSLASRSLSFGKTKFTTADLNVFCRQFSTMLTSGISVIKSLDIMHSQTEKPQLKAVIKNVYENVQKGQSLSSAFKSQSKAFPDLLINMVEAGEVSGTLDRIILKVADHFEKDVKTQNKVKGAMVYPMVLGGLTIGVVTLMLVFVLPTFINMFKSLGAKLPLPTQILLAISGFITSSWYIIIFVGIAIAVAWMNYLKSSSGRLQWDTIKLKLPIVGKMNRTVACARFCRTMSTIMQSGIPLLKSLEVTARVLGNKFYEKALNEIKEEIRRGTPLSQAIKKADIFPMMLYSMVNIGEESGTLDEILAKTATFYDEEADAAISKTISMLEPLMIVIMALCVGFIVISIITPVYSMMNNIK